MHYTPPPQQEAASVIPQPTNRAQRRLAARNACWYWHKPEWWQK